MQGSTRDPLSFDDGAFDEVACLSTITQAGFGSGVFYHYLLKQLLAIIYGQLTEAVQFAELAAPTRGAVMGTLFEATHCFYHALALSALCPSGQGQVPAAVLEMLTKLQAWAEHCPENQ